MSNNMKKYYDDVTSKRDNETEAQAASRKLDEALALNRKLYSYHQYIYSYIILPKLLLSFYRCSRPQHAIQQLCLRASEVDLQQD